MATTALAQVPPMLHYQARIASDGQAITPETTVAFAFQLLDPANDNEILWRSYPLAAGDPVDGGGFDSENLLPVEVRNGQTSVLLGSGGAPNLNESIPLDPVFFDPDAGTTRPGVRLRAWMALDGGALVRLEPDIEFASVPYAMTARFAETVADRSITTEKLEDSSITSEKLADESITADKVADGVSVSFATQAASASMADNSQLLDGQLPSFWSPPGGMMAYGGSEDPPGWLVCDGRELSRTTYAALFAAIGTTYGAGNGTTTFNIPDARGLVLRGTGTQSVNGRSKVGPTLGAVQEDQMQRISGSTSRTLMSNTGSYSGAFSGNVQATGVASTGDSFRRESLLMDSANSPNARTSFTTDGETRVSSLGVNFIIKF